MILTAVGTVAFAVAAFALAARYVSLTHQVLAVTAAWYPFLILAAPTALILFAVSGRWIAVGLAAALTVVMISVELPFYVRTKPGPCNTVTLRVMSANLRLGRAVPESVVAAAEKHADVVAFQELTPELAKNLSALDEVFPHRYLEPREHADGVGIWSRFPLVQTRQLPGYQMAVVGARIRLEGASADPTLVVVHLAQPFPKPLRLWRRDLARLAIDLRELAESAGEGAVIVAGDFNATSDMRDFRCLLRDGYRDAAAQAGAGINPTFPSVSFVPPMMGLDHILTFQATANSVRTIRIARTDHLALIAEISIGSQAT